MKWLENQTDQEIINEFRAEAGAPTVLQIVHW